MTAEILKLPYSVSRRVIARRPRRSKNGTPEDRAAKAAALTAAQAPVSIKVHRSVAPDPNAPLTDGEFRSMVEQLTPAQLAQVKLRISRFVIEEAANKKKAAKKGAAPKLVAVSDPLPPGAA